MGRFPTRRVAFPLHQGLGPHRGQAQKSSSGVIVSRAGASGKTAQSQRGRGGPAWTAFMTNSAIAPFESAWTCPAHRAVDELTVSSNSLDATTGLLASAEPQRPRRGSLVRLLPCL